MKAREQTRRQTRRRYSSLPSFTILVLMATSTRHFLTGCGALVSRSRIRERSFIVSPSTRTSYDLTDTNPPTRCSRLSSLSAASENETSNGKAPKLVLPSHPDFPITSVMAPMVAASDYPFRLFLREYCNVDMTFTQMLLAKRFIVDPTFRKAHLDLYETMDTSEALSMDPDALLPSQIECLGDWDEHRDRLKSMEGNQRPFTRHQTAPLIVQLAGDDADMVVQTALMIYEMTDGKLHGVDLNCGCPQNIAKKGNYGAFLMERDSERVNEILAALRKNLPSEVGVSAKIRLPLDDDTLRERIPRLLDSGISFLTVHGRTLKENKTKVQGAHIDRVRLAVEIAHKLDPDFPVVANGGMENYDDIQRILKATGASAAMSSEALLETPDLFMKESTDFRTPEEQFQRHLSFAKNYLDVCDRVGPPLPGVLGYNKGGSFNVVRMHLFKFLHRYLNTEQADLRDKLAANGEDTMRTLGEARSLVKELESRYQNVSEEKWNDLASSSPQATWYRRHRKPERSVHERPINGMDGSSSESSANSVEDRKRDIKERLAKLKARKLKQGERTKQFV